MDHIIHTSRIIHAGECGVFLCCIHSTKYENGYSIMDATIVDMDKEHDPERVTIIRQDPEWRADELANTVEELNGFHYVILCEDGRLDDCGGLAGICPCGEQDC